MFGVMSPSSKHQPSMGLRWRVPEGFTHSAPSKSQNATITITCEQTDATAPLLLIAPSALAEVADEFEKELRVADPAECSSISSTDMPPVIASTEHWTEVSKNLRRWLRDDVTLRPWTTIWISGYVQFVWYLSVPRNMFANSQTIPILSLKPSSTRRSRS